MSEQDVATPRAVLRAVEDIFGPISFDLAATAGNAICERFFSPADDALAQDWTSLCGNLWLNPPYDNIGPWAAKSAASAPEGQQDRRVFLLVPASVGAEWFARHVHGRALVLALRPRIHFVGHHNAYPKDVLLCVYGEPANFQPWRWDADAVASRGG